MPKRARLLVATAVAVTAPMLLVAHSLIRGGDQMASVGTDVLPVAERAAAPGSGFDAAALAGTRIAVAEFGPDPVTSEAAGLALSNAIALRPDEVPYDLSVALQVAMGHLLSGLDAPPPYSLELLGTKAGSTWLAARFGDTGHAVVAFDDGAMVIAEGRVEPWSHIDYTPDGAPNFPDVEIAWLGLPDGVSYVRFISPGSGSSDSGVVRIQRVLADAAIFRVARPPWNQAATLTAYSPSGEAMAEAEILVQGGVGSCSGQLAGSPVWPSLEGVPLPVIETVGRVAALAYACGFDELGQVASDGTYLGGGADELASALREADRHWPVMRHLALFGFGGIPLQQVERDGQVIFVLTGPRLEMGIGETGEWVYLSVVG